jgi:hypothetical protein
MHWESKFILSKMRELLKVIDTMNLTTFSTGNSPTGNKKISDLLDFGIIKSIPKNYYRIKFCYELSSDHSPIIITINNKIMVKGKPCTLYNAKTT